MSSALIGYSGFVGSNLRRQMAFDDLYNSRNIDTIHGRHYDLMVICAAPAVKWYANQHAAEDLACITRLIDDLSQARAARALLISTIDVYPCPIGVDENTPIDPAQCHPYGRHRLMLEGFVGGQFNAQILRLPGLFGRGLKKNVIFDYLNDNEVEKIDTRNVFQFYYLEHLAYDVDRVLASDIRLLNLAAEPIETALVAKLCTGKDIVNEVANHPVRYDFRSAYAERLGGANGYLYSRAQTIADLEDYISKARAE